MIGAPAINIARLQADLDALSGFREPDLPGWTRRVFSEPYVRSREWVASTMRDAGLDVRRDPAGNLVGTLDGGAPALVTGSHTDSVASGGRFDGPLGVLGAIEVARSLRDSGHHLKHALRVVDFVGEEPNDFGISCVGSRAVTRSLTHEHLALRNPSGRTLAEALASIGGDANRIEEAVWPASDVLAFVELHIEQGPVLEQKQIQIGIVTGIAGIERLHFTFEGQPGHAGTTPMSSRHDALCAAAEAILAIEQLAAGSEGVATAGRIEALPGALNVIPGTVDLWAEFRHIDAAWLDASYKDLAEMLETIGARRGVKIATTILSRSDPVPTSVEVRAAMAGAVRDLGLTSISLPSGAGHDAAHMARLGPMGMLFVPSVGGLSHRPDESTSPEDLEAGVKALLATLLELDQR